MKTKNELNEEILKTQASIKENNPELLKYLDEMMVAFPTERESAITKRSLIEYNNLLQSMVKEYNKYVKKHIVIIGAGFAGLK